MASLVAMLGFLVIPARRRKALLRAHLSRALRTEFEQAQARGTERRPTPFRDRLAA